LSIAQIMAVRITELERELEAERDSYRHECNRLAERVMKNETRIAELEDEDAAFERVWAVVSDWDISTEPGAMRLYEGINGDHVRAIVRAALRKGGEDE